MIVQGSIFENKQFVLDLSTKCSFKIKQELKEKIIGQGGLISYIVNKNSDYVIHDDLDENETYKTQRAKNYGIPLITVNFIDDCIQANKLLDHQKYYPECFKAKVQDNFNDGKINISDDLKEKQTKHFRFSNFKVFQYKNETGPFFHSYDHAVAKATLLKGRRKKDKIPFCLLELHISKAENIEGISKYCVFTHIGIFSSTATENESKQCRYTCDVNEAMLIYNHLYKLYVTPPNSMSPTKQLLNKELGSDSLISSEWFLGPISLKPEIQSLVSHIWEEALLNMEDKLSVPFNSLSFEKIETAKMLLWTILSDFQNGYEDKTKLQNEFYELIPHKIQHELNSSTQIKEKFLDCQMISDLKMANESLETKSISELELKYMALHCNIELLDPNTVEFQDLVSQFIKNSSVTVDRIYKIHHFEDYSEYDNSVGNEKLLFHPTKIKDLISLLSRGLSHFDECYLHALDDLTHRSTDQSEIYFLDSIDSCLKYKLAPPSSSRGTRMILLNEVSLGNCSDAYLLDDIWCLEDCDSVHCISKQINIQSEFDFDEYVIFDSRRQKMKYLIEFHLKDDQIKTLEIPYEETAKVTYNTDEDIDTPQIEEKTNIDLNQFLNQPGKNKQLKAELRAKGLQLMLPLQSVHVRATLIDLASEVTIIQEFINNHTEMIEGKYIFPLAEKAVVCGFEAFTEGRHFIGRIEEKREAHREYRQAVSAGQKAFLMDEESPEVFSITIGNISPGATVFIKITYVSELELQGDLVKFQIPESLTPSTEISDGQILVESKFYKSSETISTSLEVFLDMPFPIRSITSTTHKLITKKTETKAVTKLKLNDSLSNGFRMLIGLTEIHSPRMWVEESTLKKSEACMLAFYPEFNVETTDETEIILALDVSNSMQGEGLINAQLICLLCLHFLPENCKFNVIRFGSIFEELFPIALPRSLDTIQDAQQFVLSSKAKLGNSNVRHLFHSHYLLPLPSNTTRNILLITDGYFNCPNELFSVASTNRHHTRIFTFGFDPSCNNHLLLGLATSGGGSFEFFDNKLKHRWESKVKMQIDKTLQPVLTNVTVDWQRFEHKDEELIQAPSIVTTVFNGSRLIVYGLISNCSLATLKANVKGHELSSVVYTSELAKTKGNTLHRLCTRAIVEDWSFGILRLNRTQHELSKQKLKPSVIELSKQYGIVTPLTSFVSVEDKDESLGNVPSNLNDILQSVNVDFLPYLQFETDGTDDSPVACSMKHKKIKQSRLNPTFRYMYNAIPVSASPPVLFGSQSTLPIDASPPVAVFGSQSTLPIGASPPVVFGSQSTLPKSAPQSLIFGSQPTLPIGASPPPAFGSQHILPAASPFIPNLQADFIGSGFTLQSSVKPDLSFGCAPLNLQKKKLPSDVVDRRDLQQQQELHSAQLSSSNFFAPLTELRRSATFSVTPQSQTGFAVNSEIKIPNDQLCYDDDLEDEDDYETAGVEIFKRCRSSKSSSNDSIDDFIVDNDLAKSFKDLKSMKKKRKKKCLKSLLKEEEMLNQSQFVNASKIAEGKIIILENNTLSLGFGLPFVSALMKAFPKNWWLYNDVALYSLQKQKVFTEYEQESLLYELSEDIKSVLACINELGGLDKLNLPKKVNRIINPITYYLEEAGINSLAKPIKDAILSLLITLMTIIDICDKLCPDLLPLDLNDPVALSKQADDVVYELCTAYSEVLQFQFYALLIYVNWINHRYPLVYHNLELGNSWEEALGFLISQCSLN